MQFHFIYKYCTTRKLKYITVAGINITKFVLHFAVTILKNLVTTTIKMVSSTRKQCRVM